MERGAKAPVGAKAEAEAAATRTRKATFICSRGTRAGKVSSGIGCSGKRVVGRGRTRVQRGGGVSEIGLPCQVACLWLGGKSLPVRPLSVQKEHLCSPHLAHHFLT